MNKVWDKVRKSILFNTILIVVIFVLLHFILKIFNIRFRQWVYYVMTLFAVLGTIIGTIQIFRKGNKGTKISLGIIFLCILILLVMFWRIILLFVAFSYKPEHVIEKDGKKYVAYVNSFLDVNVNYYNYINFFLVGNKIKIEEWYGNGGYDPFDGRHNDTKPINTYYYDDAGKIIKRESCFGNDVIKTDNTNDVKYVEDTPRIIETTIDGKEVLYEKKISDQIIIKVVVEDCILAQRSIIGVYKSIDGGDTWKVQGEKQDDFVQIHNGAEIVFIDENIGFINDFGQDGTPGDNRKLLVTTNGGKNFEEAIINYMLDYLYIDDVPYVENGVLKFKAHTTENSERRYYYFTSKDNGITWNVI